MSLFHAEVFQNAGGYLDIDLIDTSPKSDCRLWVLTKTQEGDLYAVLRRSPDRDADFDDGVALPPKAVLMLALAAGDLLKTEIVQ